MGIKFDLGKLKLLVCLFVFIGSLGLSAQQFNEKQVQLIEGKTYYLHKVEKGNTIYSLSKMYSIKVKDLLSENPQLEEGLKIGQVIRIPIKKVDSKLTGGNSPVIDGETLIHEVLPKETLYGLSKQYNVSVAEIQKLNPELTQGLKIGMELKIPLPTQEVKGVSELAMKPAEVDSFLLHFVEPQQTLYSLAIDYDVNIDSIRLVNGGLPDGLKVGTTIRIPTLNSEITGLKEMLLKVDSVQESPVLWDATEIKDEYLISLLIPFYLDSNDSIRGNKKDFEKDFLYSQSKIGIEFYTGFKTALDEFKSDTTKIKVQVYDVSLDRYSKSTSSMRELTNSADFFESDLIVGPFHRSNFELASAYSKKARIPIVTPVPHRKSSMDTNQYVIKVHSSDEAQVDFLRNFTLDKWKGKNVILVENNELKDVILSERFQGIANADTNFSLYNEMDSLVNKVKFYEFDTAKLNRVLIDSIENILLMPMKSKTFVGQFLAGLNKYSGRYNIKVVGLDSWNKMGYLEYRYLNNLKVHIVSNQYVNYADSTTQEFVMVYRNTYETEPTEWAFLGYDLASYFMNALSKYGTAVQNYFDENSYEGLSKNFDFKRNGVAEGFENSGLRVVKIENYQYYQIK
ncbi:MAG: amino acid ABC transporter substrate-binding protein [Salibacteraceae bacterium]